MTTLRKYRFFLATFTILGMSVIIPSELIKGDISEAIGWTCLLLLVLQITADDKIEQKQ